MAQRFWFAVAAVFLRAQARAECRLPEPAPAAIERLTPDQLVDGGHYLRAIRVLDPLAAHSPDDARLAWLLSRAGAGLGDFDRALKLAESAVATDGTNAEYRLQLAAVAGSIAQHSSLLKQLSFARRAKKEIDAALELQPANARAQWGQMMFYFAAPPLLGGDKAKAQAIGESLAASQPEPGFYFEGRLALEMKDLVKAEQFFRQAILEDPLSFDNAAALANFYLEHKPDQARAERWACFAVHADPLRGEAWALLAKTKAMCGCWTEAVAIAERAESVEPDDLSPWLGIAQAAVARGQQLDIAADWLRHYLSRPPNGEAQSTAAPARELLKTLSKDRR